MSQAKVDRYKEQKANRKEILLKQKRHNQMIKASVAVVAALMLCWLGYSIYDTYQDSQPREVVEINYTAIEDYLNSIGVDE